MNYKCNNYHSSYCFINNKPIKTDKYVKLLLSSNSYDIKCHKGHSLIFVNGKKRIPHFRHKNTDDIKLNDNHSLWHKNWQSLFPYIEIQFPKKPNQIKIRRCDVKLTNNYIIEFQHSIISSEEIANRKNDYKLHNIDIIWVIDGCHSDSDIKLMILNGNENENENGNENGNENEKRYYLEFRNNLWKYESFINNYEYIFVDINNYIYKIYPKSIKNNMIDVEPPITKELFIKYLYINHDFIYTNNNFDNIHQSTIYIKQQGAGNGKTFGLIQNLDDEKFEHYEYFVIITKQHSAKTVIYNELIMQIDKGYLKNINKDDIIITNDAKKYQISYINTKINKKCYILITTVDSFMYNLGNKYNNEINKFEGIVKSICDDIIDIEFNKEFEKIKFIKCNKKEYYLNKKLCLFIDETQDLTDDYGKAIIRIMKDKYIDAYIVGDKLQSISFMNNAFIYLQECNLISSIKRIILPYSNIVRRFHQKDLINFINNIIPFHKYSLPSISSYNDDDNNNNDNDNIQIIVGDKIFNNENDENDNNDNDNIQIIVGDKIFNNENDENDKNNINNILKNINQIMIYYNNEVVNNNKKPNDFLIITPFTTKNYLVSALETKIQEYWIQKEKPDDYIRYAIFHKSDLGNSIDLTESENATRIVSIHTSKGDGRDIVFVIGLTENALIRFSKNKDNLIYDSLIHVALTRMKERLYIRIDNINDDIADKINNGLIFTNKISIKEPKLNYKNYIKYNDLTNNYQDFQEIYENIIKNTNYNSSGLFIINNNIIDMGHHHIRYTSMRIKFLSKTLDYKTEKEQIKAIINNISKKKIIETQKFKDYYNYYKDIKNKNKNLINKTKDIKKAEYDICILEITGSIDYQKYYAIIFSFISNIKRKIIKNDLKLLCPYESIILNYIIEIIDKGFKSEFSINQLYNITDIYYKSYNKNLNIKGHTNCKCNELFNFNHNNHNNNDNYLINHYEYINNISVLFDNFMLKYPNINWLLNHKINYIGSNSIDYNIYKQFDILGYDDNNVYIIYLKPQITEFNFKETLINSITDTHIINTINNYDNDNGNGNGNDNGNDNDNDNNNGNDNDNDNNNDNDNDNDNDNGKYDKIKNDYNKFSNKNIITVIFALNIINYIIIDWKHKDTNENLIIKNNLELKTIIANNIIESYNNNSCYYYYKYLKNQKKDIKEIINKIKDDYKEIPEFIIDFFKSMRKNKDCNYDDINIFNQKLKDEIKDNIYDFINVY
jgi:competence CoiA-like predicted nuclease